jgi:outer membrane protein TolC
VPINVASALTDLRLSAASLEAANAAVLQYEQALGDEQDKLREGVGTVLDLRFTQDLLIQARLSQTELKRRYAAALARLRFETGALPSEPAVAPAAVRALTE